MLVASFHLFISYSWPFGDLLWRAFRWPPWELRVLPALAQSPSFVLPSRHLLESATAEGKGEMGFNPLGVGIWARVAD